MLKKLIGFALKAIWIIVVLLTPTILVFLYLYFFYDQLANVGNAIRYFVPIVFISLLAWKSPCSLFVLSLGFLITLATYPIGSWLLGKPYWSAFKGDFAGMRLVVICMEYSFPFAFYSLITAIIVLKIRKKLSEKGKSFFGFLQPKKTASLSVLQLENTNKTDDMEESETPNKTNQ